MQTSFGINEIQNLQNPLMFQHTRYKNNISWEWFEPDVDSKSADIICHPESIEPTPIRYVMQLNKSIFSSGLIYEKKETFLFYKYGTN